MPPRRSNSRRPKAKPRAARVWTSATTTPIDTIRHEVESRARELIDTVFKPRHLRPPPATVSGNYISDITAHWKRAFFYFVSTYTCPHPDALSPTFEAPFTRMGHKAGGRFDLAFMRHTNQWAGIHENLTLDEAFARIRDEEFFWPHPLLGGQSSVARGQSTSLDSLC